MNVVRRGAPRRRDASASRRSPAIEPEWSSTSTSEACAHRRRVVRTCGRASATRERREPRAAAPRPGSCAASGPSPRPRRCGRSPPPGSAARSGARAGARARCASERRRQREQREQPQRRGEAHRRSRAARRLEPRASARSQSLSVSSATCATRSRRSSRRELGAALALELLEAGAQARRGGVDLDPLAALGVDERERARPPAARSRAGRAPRSRATAWRARRPPRAARSSPCLVAEVGDDRHEAGRARERRQPRERVGERAAVAPPSAATPGVEQVAHGGEPGPRAARRQHDRRAGAERRRRRRSRRGGPRAGRARARRPRRRRPSAAVAVPNAIDGERSSTIQRRQRALGDVQAHVRLAGARGRGGVEVAHVVAGLVGAQLRELGAAADAGGAAVAGQARARPGAPAATSIASSSARGIGPGPWRPGGGCEPAAVLIRALRGPRQRRPSPGSATATQQPLDHGVGGHARR